MHWKYVPNIALIVIGTLWLLLILWSFNNFWKLFMLIASLSHLHGRVTASTWKEKYSHSLSTYPVLSLCPLLFMFDLNSNILLPIKLSLILQVWCIHNALKRKVHPVNSGQWPHFLSPPPIKAQVQFSYVWFGSIFCVQLSKDCRSNTKW